MKTIVVAWLEVQTFFTKGAKEKTRAEPYAATWLLEGNDEDRARAEKHVQGLPNGCVFEFETSEPDPLGKARSLVRKAAALEGAIGCALEG